MEIWANNQKIPFEVQQEKNLGDLITSLLLLTNEANKVIMEIEVDGEIVPLEERQKYESRPLENIKRVNLVVEGKLQMSLFALAEAKRMLPEFSVKLSEVSGLLMAGQKNKAMTIFANSLDTWRKIISYLKTVRVAYKLDLTNVTYDGKNIEDKNTELLKSLQEIKVALEKEDVVALSDLLEYELISQIDEQVKIIEKIEDVVKEADVKVQEKLQSQIEVN